MCANSFFSLSPQLFYIVSTDLFYILSIGDRVLRWDFKLKNEHQTKILNLEFRCSNLKFNASPFEKQVLHFVKEIVASCEVDWRLIFSHSSYYILTNLTTHFTTLIIV